MDSNPNHPTADPTELVVDYPRGELRYRGSVLPIQPGSILFKTIGGLASAGAQGLSKEELFAAVWSMSFRRETHGQLIYVTIRRVRRILPVETIEGRYRFPRGFGVTVVGMAPDPSMPGALPPRQSRILAIISQQSDPIVARRAVAATLRISARTALRDLTELYERGLLERSGAGRSVTYRRRDSEAAQG